MNLRFQNQIVLVTGGTSGIGRDASVGFAREGAFVYVTGRREAEGTETVRLIEAAGGQGVFVRNDITDEEAFAGVIARIREEKGRLDVAFNNAGVEGRNNAPIVNESVENYQFIFDINVRGILISMKHEIPLMLKSGGGAIVNTSSVAGKMGMPGAGIYVASKHAVEGLTKTAALEQAAHGIRINALAPAVIETEMFERFTGGNAEAQAYMRSLHPIGRSGVPAETTAAVLFLASKEASFITGESLNVDGGWLAK